MKTQKIIEKIENGRWNEKFYGPNIYVSNEKISLEAGQESEIKDHFAAKQKEAIENRVVDIQLAKYLQSLNCEFQDDCNPDLHAKIIERVNDYIDGRLFEKSQPYNWTVDKLFGDILNKNEIHYIKNIGKKRNTKDYGSSDKAFEQGFDKGKAFKRGEFMR